MKGEAGRVASACKVAFGSVGSSAPNARSSKHFGQSASAVFLESLVPQFSQRDASGEGVLKLAGLYLWGRVIRIIAAEHVFVAVCLPASAGEDEAVKLPGS